MLWTLKYRPQIEQIPHETKQIVDFVSNFKKQKKKALLLYGPTGTGKTAAVHALARKMNLELVEVNASDYRTAGEIEAKLGVALKQQSLFGGAKLIFVDELDGISGQQDRGGVGAIADLVKEPAFPVILCANDPFDSKFSSLRSKSQMIEFPAVEITKLTALLKNIAEKEKLNVTEDVLKTIARRSGGDLRGAINDLQTLASSKELTPEGVNTLSDREKGDTIMNALVKILKSTDPMVAKTALESVGEDVDEAMLWIDENLPKEYTNPADLARAYNSLSRADVFKGRIRRWQYWRYLVYVYDLMTAGVAVAKDKKSPAFVQYGRTQRILKIWMANNKYAKRKAIAGKLGSATHTSTKKAITSTLPYLRELYSKKHASAGLLTQELDLDEEQVEWMGK